jgi:hypothetical protein
MKAPRTTEAVRRVLFAFLIFLVFSISSVAADNDFLLTPGKAGPIEIGMDVDALYMRIGRDRTKLVDKFLEGYFTPVLEIYLDGSENNKPPMEALLSWGYTVDSIVVNDPRFKTAEDIGIGSSLGEIRKQYDVDSIGFGEGPLCAIVKQIGMTFALDFFKVPPAWDRTRDPRLIPDSAKVTLVFLWQLRDRTRKPESR